MARWRMGGGKSRWGRIFWVAREGNKAGTNWVSNGYLQPKIGRYEGGRAGSGVREKPNLKGLFMTRTNRGGWPLTVFKTGALNHSATLPTLRHQPLSGRKIKNGSEQKWFWP